MSLPAILERIAQIDQIVAPKPKPSASTTGSSSDFLHALTSGISASTAR